MNSYPWNTQIKQSTENTYRTIPTFTTRNQVHFLKFNGFFAVFFYFFFLRRIRQEFISILVVLFGRIALRQTFSSHLKTLYFRKFSSRIWPLPGANFANENFEKEKDSRQAKCIFVNRSNSSTYGTKICKICDSTQKVIGRFLRAQPHKPSCAILDRYESSIKSYGRLNFMTTLPCVTLSR